MVNTFNNERIDDFMLWSDDNNRTLIEMACEFEDLLDLVGFIGFMNEIRLGILEAMNV